MDTAWNFEAMTKGLPNLNTNMSTDMKSNYISWHMIDIAHNYIHDRINWQDKIIELKDSKQLICYSFWFYSAFSATSSIDDIKALNNGMIDVEAIRSYFETDAFDMMFKNVSCKCKLTPASFIIIPVYETTKTMYVALLNLSKEYSAYLQNIYSCRLIDKFFNLIDVTDGLQNHTSITGIQHATSFNLFKSLYHTVVDKYNKRQPVSSITSHAPTKLVFNETCALPIVLLFNTYNYFPRLQVVWSTDKIFLKLPGVDPPTNDLLLKNNGVLKIFNVNKWSVADENKIPIVMRQSMHTMKSKTKQKQTPEWLHAYKKYCGDESSHYTNITKLLDSMNRLVLEAHKDAN
jgi:hypothetical protein